MEKLIDSYNRRVDYLRISLTDRCNLRCVYCMPEEGLANAGYDSILRYEEILRIVKVAVNHGVTKIRLTGGEPLVRKGVVEFIKKLNKIDGLEDLSLTTNGVVLSEYARDLADAGLKRINVSLDSLDPVKYMKMTGKDHLYRVLDGLKEAEKVGLYPIKVNAVIIKGFNDDEIIDFALITKKKSYHIRFIEYMPFEARETWERGKFLSVADIISTISNFQTIYPLEMLKVRTGPARRYRFEDGKGELGFISPISDHFCTSCNRLRITADGKLRTCLFSDAEIDVKEMLRNGCDDGDLRKTLFEAIKTKPEKHYIDENIFKKCARSMSLIGG
jgi:cyclic pyranopterin phosphate synthase